MSIRVCDALCGSGKTSACIKMMNNNKDSKYLFVTQFLSEVDRIKESCASREFYSPDSDLKAGHTKLADIHELLRQGRNIATTHALFTNYTEESKRLITEQNYTLILDESVKVLQMSDIAGCDIKILFDSNYIVEEDGMIRWALEKEYDEFDEKARFRNEVIQAKSKNFLKYKNNYFFWSIPPELFTCFKDVYVLTYMFNAQTLRYFFDMYNLSYEYIGVKQIGYRDYDFCPPEEMDRRRDLRSKVHIVENNKLNEIGNGRTDLSFSWYTRRQKKKDDPQVEKMRKTLINVTRNIFKCAGEDFMWSTFKAFRPKLEGKGFKNSFITYNIRASNDYAHKHYLAYCVNNFPRPWETRFFKEHGVVTQDDSYALSILVQWVFRSAIRNGEEIYLYIPSKRMRYLFTLWLDKLAEGKDTEPLTYLPK